MDLLSALSVLPRRHPRQRLGRTLLAATLGFATAASAGTTTLGVADARVVEGNAGTRTLDFTLTRGGDLATRLLVPYQVKPGTATAGSDYLAPPAVATLRLDAGAAQGRISIPVLGDSTVEPDETLSLLLGANAVSLPTAPFPQDRQTLDQGTLGIETGVATADFDGDGRIDMATTNPGRNSVSVLLNQGGALRVAGAPQYPVGRRPQDNTVPGGLVTGDFNGDGKPDLLTLNGNGTITVLLNQGKGVFPTPPPPTDPNASYTPTYAVGGYGSPIFGNPGGVSVVTGDFNGDRRTDLAVVDFWSCSVKVLLNKGDGSFPASWSGITTFPGETPPVTLAVGDLDNDGRTDLAVSLTSLEDTQTVAILLNQGQGAFVADGRQAPTYQTAISGPIAIADFDGDGWGDIAGLHGYGQRLVVLPNAGNGTFVPAAQKVYPLGAYVSTMLAGDFNGDGQPDLAATTNDDRLIVLFNQGDGSGNLTPIGGGASVQTLADWPLLAAAADFSGDGRPELVTNYLDIFDTTLDVLPNHGDGTFATGRVPLYPAYPIPGGAFGDYSYTPALASADFSGDGRPDIAALSYYNNAVGVLINQGGGAFPTTKVTAYPVGRSPAAVVAADFDNNGQPDLAVQNYGDGTVSMLLNQGGGRFPGTLAPSYPLGGSAMVTADFNGDGKPDLAARYGNGVAVALNQGGGRFPTTNPPVYPAPGWYGSLVVGDFNGDGRPDLATTGLDGGPPYPGTVTVLLNRGDGTFPTSGAPTYAVADYTYAIASGDYDGDGRPDLAVASANIDQGSFLGTVTVLLNQGQGGFPKTGWPTYPTGSIPTVIATADFNGDGRPDLITNNAYSATANVLLNRGGAAFDTLDPTRLEPYGGPMVATDLNADGKPDLAVGGAGVSILLNAYAPASTVSLTRTTATGTIVNDDTANDKTPDAFGFSPVTGVAKSVFVTSEPKIPSGFNTPAPVSVANGQYAIRHGHTLGAFTTAAGTLQPGDAVVVRQVSSANPETTLTTTLTIGATNATFAVTTLTADRVPDYFEFLPVTEAPRGSLASSRPVGIYGFDIGIPITVSGGRYALVHNGVTSAFTSAGGTIQPGDSVIAQVTVPTTFSTPVTAQVTIGGVTSPFDVTSAPPDTQPDPFSFPAIQDAPKNTWVTSQPVVIHGIDSPAGLGSYDSNIRYAVIHNGVQGAFMASGGSVVLGDSVVMQMLTANWPRFDRTVYLYVGGVPGAFSATTTVDTTPDPFQFAPVGGQLPDATVNSAAVTIQGFDTATPISVSGGQYAIVDYGVTGYFRTTSGILYPGEGVVAQVTTPFVPGAGATATVTIGGVRGTFTATTVGPGSYPTLP